MGDHGVRENHANDSSGSPAHGARSDDSSAQKVDPSLVAEIVSSYVGHNSIAIDQLAGLIATVHRTLSGLGQSAPEPVALVPAVPIRRSVQHDHVVHARTGYDIYRDGLNTPAILDMLPPVRGLCGLGIGCGEGSNTRELALLGARMHAIELDPRHAPVR